MTDAGHAAWAIVLVAFLTPIVVGAVAAVVSGHRDAQRAGARYRHPSRLEAAPHPRVRLLPRRPYDWSTERK